MAPGGLAVGGGAGFVVFADGVFPGSAGLEAGEAEFVADVVGCPGGFAFVSGAAQPELVGGQAAQVDAVDLAERGERRVPVGPGLG